MRNNLNLPIPLLANLHRFAQVPYPPIDLDLIVEELFESGDVEDFVRGGLRGVDYELRKRKTKSRKYVYIYIAYPICVKGSEQEAYRG